MGIQWAIEYCSNSKFYLFTDDDIYVNPNLMINYLVKQVTPEIYPKLYAGHVFSHSRPYREQTSKWFVSLNDYPYFKYPPYVSGPFRLLSAPTLSLFYTVSKQMQSFRYEDVYLGILAYRLSIAPVNLASVCAYRSMCSSSDYVNGIMASHGFPQQELTSIWNQFKDAIEFKPKSYEEFF